MSHQNCPFLSPSGLYTWQRSGRGDAARGVLRDYWEYWGYCERTPEKEEFFRSLGADPFVQTKTLH